MKWQRVKNAAGSQAKLPVSYGSVYAGRAKARYRQHGHNSPCLGRDRVGRRHGYGLIRRQRWNVSGTSWPVQMRFRLTRPFGPASTTPKPL